jgi:hypothetical protein
MALNDLFGKKKFRYKGSKKGKGWKLDSFRHALAAKGVGTKANGKVASSFRFKVRCYTCKKLIGGSTMSEAYDNLRDHRREEHGDWGFKLF